MPVIVYLQNKRNLIRLLNYLIGLYGHCVGLGTGLSIGLLKLCVGSLVLVQKLNPYFLSNGSLASL